MWLEDLTNYVRECAIPNLGDRVFMHTMPHGTNPCAMLASGYNGMPIDKELPGFHRGSLQVIVRGRTTFEVETIANAISEALTVHEREFATSYVNSLEPRHLPAVFPRSNGDFFEGSVNFDICFVAL